TRLEEGHRHARRGPAHREVLRGGRLVPLKQYKATSPVRRFRQSASFEELTKGKKPERSLTERKLRHAGRNAQGRVTTRHRGGGEKRNYRIVDFKRDKDGIPATVKAIEYDPNRSAHLALLFYKDGEKRYIIAPVDLRAASASSTFAAARPSARSATSSTRTRRSAAPGTSGTWAGGRRSAASSCHRVTIRTAAVRPSRRWVARPRPRGASRPWAS